jgi:protocatechuate 3,4-dioxygenase beta subunit
MNRRAIAAALLVLALTSAQAWQQPGQQAQGGQGPGGRGGNQQQLRDRAQQQTPQGTSVISGRVLAADTGRPVKRARVTVAAGGPGGGRGNGAAITDDQGRYSIGALGAGNYNITASKAGFVDSIYGQRRPLQPGTPLTLGDGQTATNVDLRLIRGGVITGRVGDEDGEPLARALVTVQRYQYIRGERQLTPAGGDQTDDRGAFRIFGLPPGDYYVSATTSGLGELLGRGMQQLAAGLALGGGRGGAGAFAGFGGPEQPAASGYAPTYYPGVVSPAEAGKVVVGAGQEVGSIDFQIQLVPLATISGMVAGSQEPATVMLVPQNSGVGLGPLGGQTFNGRATSDGSFAISNVPPGRYTAIARSGGRSGDVRMGTAPVVVTGENIAGLTLVLQPGVTVSGNITVESSGTPSPSDYSIFRVDVADADPLPGAGGRGGRGGPFAADNRVEKNGSFALTGIQPGLHYVRVTGGGGGQAGGATPTAGGGSWTLKSVLIGGADVADVPFEIKPGQNVDGVTVVMTDRATDLSGTVRDAQNGGAAALTVIAFSTDPQHWRAQSRRISTSRSGASGAYRIRGLPAGDYYVLATDDVEQGEWFDPAYLDSVKDKATRVTLQDGDSKSLDLRAATQSN